MTDTDSLAKVVEELRKFGMFETADRIERLDAEMREQIEITRQQRAWRELLTHKLITCGVAAHHPDPNLSKSGVYAGKWDSPQAQDVRALRDERDDLRTRLAACENLRAFAREALEDFWEGDGTMQDLGEKHRLLIPTTVNEPCGEGCSCAEYGADFPTECYRFAPVLAAQSSAKGVE